MPSSERLESGFEIFDFSLHVYYVHQRQGLLTVVRALNRPKPRRFHGPQF